MDFVGRVENFEEDFQALCQKIGYTVASTENRNVSDAKKGPVQELGTLGSTYLKFYDAQSVRIVNEAHHDDFERLGYEQMDPATM